MNKIKSWLLSKTRETAYKIKSNNSKIYSPVETLTKHLTLPTDQILMNSRKNLTIQKMNNFWLK